MLAKLTNPNFFVPAAVVALLVLWGANNFAFVGNLVGRRV